MKKIFFLLFFAIELLFLINKIFSYSFAYEYDVDNSVLFYKNDYKELADDIKIYLDNIDDFIIPNSSFLYSDKLVNNYDFLINFALDFIVNNRNYYYENIISYDTCFYINKNGIKNQTNDYVTLKTIYDITNFYFGVDDFVIINDDVCINNEYISLNDYASNIFNSNIINVSITDNDSAVEALVSYDSGDKYLYYFYNDNNVLKLVNVEVIL